jgi:hypothetical protein
MLLGLMLPRVLTPLSQLDSPINPCSQVNTPKELDPNPPSPLTCDPDEDQRPTFKPQRSSARVSMTIDTRCSVDLGCFVQRACNVGYVLTRSLSGLQLTLLTNNPCDGIQPMSLARALRKSGPSVGASSDGYSSGRIGVMSGHGWIMSRFVRTYLSIYLSLLPLPLLSSVVNSLPSCIAGCEYSPPTRATPS